MVKSTLNILHTIDVFHTGGIAELILNFHMYDRKNRHDVWCYDGTLSDEARRKGLVIWNGAPPQELQDSHYYDVVVSHTVGGWNHRDIFTWAKERGARTIEVMHSPAVSPTPSELVDGFVALNNIALSLNRHMPNAVCIYGIVPPDLFLVKRSGNLIGRLSRLADEKRPQDFLELARRFPNEMFVLAGDGQMYNQLFSSTSANLVMPGMLRDFPAFFAQLKLFVFPTRDECCSISVAMAQAAGIPVICQDIAPLRETTGGHAKFATGHEDFMKRVDEFFDPNQTGNWHHMANHARDWAWQNFSHVEVIKKWRNLFSTLSSGM